MFDTTTRNKFASFVGKARKLLCGDYNKPGGEITSLLQTFGIQTDGAILVDLPTFGTNWENRAKEGWMRSSAPGLHSDDWQNHPLLLPLGLREPRLAGTLEFARVLAGLGPTWDQ